MRTLRPYITVVAAGATLAGWVTSGRALAQSNTTSTAPPEAAPTLPTLEEIVVTANKRVENAQSVGTAVSVVSGTRLEEQKLEQLSDYVALLPGVTANSSGTPGQSSLTIRGVSPLSAGSKVATYIDEAPLGSSGIWAQAGGLTLDLLPFDLDRLELLRGPQGTLYGASSMGGLLKYVLTTPDTHRFTADVATDTSYVTGANDPGGTFQGRVNAPLVDGVLGLSASGFYKYTPGYIDNVYTGRDDTNPVKQYGGRVAAFWQAASNLTVKLNAMWQTTDSSDDAVESVANPSVSVVPGQPRIISGGTSYGRDTESEAFAASFRNAVDFYSGTVDWNLGGGYELVSATSWSQYDVRRLANRSLSYGTYFPALGLPDGLVLGSTSLGTRKLTQEVRLVSPQSSMLAWQVGGFYTHESQSNLQLQDAFTTAYVPLAPLQPDASYITIPTIYQERAVFGDLTLTLLPVFDISAGVRYSRNDQVFDLSARGVLAGLPQLPLVSLNTIHSAQDNTTWSAGARYHFTPEVMAYFRAATGYGPGGANTPYPGVPQAVVGSETLTSYETGLKSEFLDRRALLNLAVYHIDWNNIQLAARSGAIGYTANGGSARIDGVELSNSVTPLSGLTLGLNAAYTDARLDSLNPDVTTAFLVDSKLQNVPEWTASGTLDYTRSLRGSWTGDLSGVVRWVDAQLGAQPAANAPLFTLPPYAMVDLTASITDGRYTFSLYGRNVTDARAYTGGYPYVGATGAIRQIDYYIQQPRTVGASVKASF